MFKSTTVEENRTIAYLYKVCCNVDDLPVGLKHRVLIAAQLLKLEYVFGEGKRTLHDIAHDLLLSSSEEDSSEELDAIIQYLTVGNPAANVTTLLVQCCDNDSVRFEYVIPDESSCITMSLYIDDTLAHFECDGITSKQIRLQHSHLRSTLSECEIFRMITL